MTRVGGRGGQGARLRPLDLTTGMALVADPAVDLFEHHTPNTLPIDRASPRRRRQGGLCEKPLAPNCGGTKYIGRCGRESGGTKTSVGFNFSKPDGDAGH